MDDGQAPGRADNGRTEVDVPPVSRFQVPDLGVGVGFRIPHFAEIFETRPPMPWFEIISENFMVRGGMPARNLDRLLETYTAVPHGVSMSLGSEDDSDYLDNLEILLRRVRPPWFSDHVCFTGTPRRRVHDLLPLPYLRDTLDRMVDRARAVQDRFQIPFAVENPSSYLSWRATTMPEWDFMTELAERADCGILLDVNNVFVSSVNHGFDPYEYIDALPADRVLQIHLAGHTIRPEGFRLDTHDHPVCDEVWALYQHAIRRLGPVSTLIEWDGNIPSWARLMEEADTARRWRDAALADPAPLPPRDRRPTPDAPPDRALPPGWRQTFVDMIARDEPASDAWFGGGAISPMAQLAVYQEQYVLRLVEALQNETPGLCALAEDLGLDVEPLFLDYLLAHPSTHWTLNRVADDLADWLARGGHDPRLVDMARLDHAVQRGFEAENGHPLRPEQLGELPPLRLQPPVSLLSLRFDVHRRRSALRSDSPERPPVTATPTLLAVFRKEFRMRHMELEPGSYAILAGIAAGATTVDAIGAAVAAVGPERVTAEIGTWFRDFALCDLVERAGDRA